MSQQREGLTSVVVDDVALFAQVAGAGDLFMVMVRPPGHKGVTVLGTRVDPRRAADVKGIMARFPIPDGRIEEVMAISMVKFMLADRGLPAAVIRETEFAAKATTLEELAAVTEALRMDPLRAEGRALRELILGR